MKISSFIFKNIDLIYLVFKTILINFKILINLIINYSIEQLDNCYNNLNHKV